jgi:hypothetical protein
MVLLVGEVTVIQLLVFVTNQVQPEEVVIVTTPVLAG